MPVPDARLKEVTVTPENGRYSCSFKFEVCRELPEITAEPQRICAIDFGVNNLMAATNNCGLAPVLYKDSVLKSVNQYYNKRIASIISAQTLAAGKKFVPTEKYYAVTNKRNDQINDWRKTAGYGQDFRQGKAETGTQEAEPKSVCCRLK